MLNWRIPIHGGDEVSLGWVGRLYTIGDLAGKRKDD